MRDSVPLNRTPQGPWSLAPQTVPWVPLECPRRKESRPEDTQALGRSQATSRTSVLGELPVTAAPVCTAVCVVTKHLPLAECCRLGQVNAYNGVLRWFWGRILAGWHDGM